MRPELTTLIDEFERLSLDDRLNFWFTSHDELPVCVRFHRNAGRNWSIWYPISEQASKQTVSQAHLPRVLDAFGVPETPFMEELGNVLLTQAAYADQFVREVGELLGEESVRKSIRHTQDFMDDFAEMFRCANGETSSGNRRETPPRQTTAATPPARTQKVEEETPPPPPCDFASAKQRLRIIKTRD
jgi:hypothetical protein